MQQTTKYQFKLIEGSDDFSPQPLNDNVEKVEELFQDMAETVEAVQGAYTPDNKPYVVGTYTGTFGGNGSKAFELGFRPSFLIISGTVPSSNGSGGASQYGYFLITGGNTCSDLITFTNTGFTVKQISGTFPLLLYHERTYDYIAFR